MKTALIAGLVAIASSTALAQPFDFQRQIGSEEYVLGDDAAHITFAPVARSNTVSSLSAVIFGANVDGIADNEFRGTIIESGPSRISLYEVMRDSPEGIAYAGYHARYAAGTDWDRVAREWRTAQTGGEMAADAAMHDGDS